jgi:hypothetical protein
MELANLPTETARHMLRCLVPILSNEPPHTTVWLALHRMQQVFGYDKLDLPPKLPRDATGEQLEQYIASLEAQANVLDTSYLRDLANQHRGASLNTKLVGPLNSGTLPLAVARAYPDHQRVRELLKA